MLNRFRVSAFLKSKQNINNANWQILANVLHVWIVNQWKIKCIAWEPTSNTCQISAGQDYWAMLRPCLAQWDFTTTKGLTVNRWKSSNPQPLWKSWKNMKTQNCTKASWTRPEQLPAEPLNLSPQEQENLSLKLLHLRAKRLNKVTSGSVLNKHVPRGPCVTCDK